MKAANFVNASKSFSVDLKMRQADSQIIAMQVSGTPTLVVTGKYRLNNDNLTTDQMIELVKFLVAKESAPAARGRAGGRRSPSYTMPAAASLDAPPGRRSHSTRCRRKKSASVIVDLTRFGILRQP